MRHAILRVYVLLLGFSACAQLAFGRRGPHNRAIDAAKNVSIAIFDSNLPNISLEYFLGAPIEWMIVTCDERATNPALDRGQRTNATGDKSDAPLCVQATLDNVRAQRSAMVVVRVGKVGTGVAGTPKLELVMAQDENGAARTIQLIDLPAVMRRWRSRSPRIRDVPGRLGAVG